MVGASVLYRLFSSITLWCGLIQLQLSMNSEHGLTLETGIYICKINPGSLAAKEGNLAVGDRVLSVSIDYVGKLLLYFFSSSFTENRFLFLHFFYAR